MALKVSDPKLVKITLTGIPIQGFADGDFCKIVPASEAYTTIVGADGETVRVASNDKRFDVEISLLQTSNSNDLLSALHALDQNAPNGAGVGAFTLADLNGTSLFTGPETWITMYPDQTWGKSASSRVWKLQCAEGVLNVGGN